MISPDQQGFRRPSHLLPDFRLRPKLRDGYPQYRLARKIRGTDEENPLGLEYLTERGVWAPERRNLARLIAEGMIDHRNERFLRILAERGFHVPPDFAWSAKIHTDAFQEIGGGVCARVLNVIAGNRSPEDQRIVSESGWHNLSFMMDRVPGISFIEAGLETPLHVDEAFKDAIAREGAHRAIRTRLNEMGVILNGVPYGLRVSRREKRI